MVMRVLVLYITNDDGPPNDQVSPFIRHFIEYIYKYTEWDFTICIPNQQRSWIGKAHFAGLNPTAKFIYTSTNVFDNSFIGPFSLPSPNSELDKINFVNKNCHISYEDSIEWVLLDNATPATCADIGLNHLSSKKFDLIISGPNVGRNTSAAYITSSGTIGAAIDAVINSNTRAIALSWAFFDGVKIVSDNLFYEISKRSCELIEHLFENWDTDVDLYSINAPLNEHILNSKIYYAPILENKWCSVYTEANIVTHLHGDIETGDEDGIIQFEWNPNFDVQRQAVFDSVGINDGRVIEEGNISVTPLKANFKTISRLQGEIQLTKPECLILLTISPDEYIYKSLIRAFKKYIPNIRISDKFPERINFNSKIFHYGDYEQLNLEMLGTGSNYHANSYVYRKALIRKHYLSHTIHAYLVKHPKSILNRAYLESYTIDVDYAEFLDDALDENWELRQELESNTDNKWWILKPSMCDKGQGLRIFKTIEDLQEIFNSFDEDETDDENITNSNAIITSQLRYFIVQQYLANPLLLKSMEGKKFHVRCYIVCNGDIQVYVYNRMLALFASEPFISPDNSYSVTNMDQLKCHLTNTCLQTSKTKKNSVKELDSLCDLTDTEKHKIKSQIHDITSELFLAAMNVNRLNFQPLKNCFEIYGADFLIDSKLNVKLLEINAFPDFKQTGMELQCLIDELFENVVDTCVKPIFGLQPTNNDSNFIRVLDYTSNNW